MLALVVLTALGTLSTLTVFSVRSGTATTANDRFHTIAMYAAESGGAAAMSFLRTNIDVATGWTAFVSPGNAAPPQPTGIVGNNQLPGTSDNPFTASLQAHYKVEILNNRSDSGFAGGTDTDSRVIIRSTGYGPDGAVAIIEWEVTTSVSTASRPCPNYGQRGISEDNSGRNDCLGLIDTSQAATFQP